ncbi:MAG: hypothetical protein EBR82_40785 [Caulobacteraceae bacterium]|nr:hypothetical protein [Caulobacteraceae bacterium]
MSIMTGSVIWSATVSATPTYPLFSVAVTTSSGSHTNAQRGYRVVVESSTGAYKGTLNIRAAGTISATAMPVRELTKGTSNIVSGDVLKVYDDVLLADKLVRATDAFPPDDLTYSDQNSDPPPVVCSGGWWAGRLNASGNADVPFVGSTSYTIDPDSGGSVTHSWTAPSGTFQVGTSTSADPTVRWTTAGSYNVTHSVTDSGNSKSRAQYVRVRVHSDADPPYECVIENVDATEERGWAATIRVFDVLPLSVLPDGAPVCIWTEDTVDGTEIAYGSATAGRSHILLNGYVRRDTQNVNADNPEMRFEIISPLAKLMEVPGFSKVMEYNQSPNNWTLIKSLTVKRAMVQLVAFYTWAIESGVDFTFTGFSDAEYPLLYLQAQSPVMQLRELADSRDARMICLKHGQIDVQERPELTAIGSRSGMTTIVDLTSDDVLSEGLEISREHYRPVMQLEARGFTKATTVAAATPLFSRWPGTPGYGTENTTVERLIADTQASLNERAGRRGASADRIYQSSTSVMQHAPQLTLRLRGAYWRVMDFYREWVTLNYTASSNMRGIDLTTMRWRITNISVAWEDLTAVTTLQLQAETNAEAGLTYYPPPDDTGLIDIPPFPYIPGPDETLPLPIPEFPPGTNRPPEKFWAVGYDVDAGGTVVCRTTAFNPVAQTISWETCDGNALAGIGMGGCSDPFNYKRKFVITQSGLYKTDDLWVAGTPTWTLVASMATVLGNASRIPHKIVMSVNRRGFIAIISGSDGYAYSTDYGATWSRTRTGWGTSWPNYKCDVNMAERSPGVVFFTNGSNDLYISKNYGATWTLIANIGYSSPTIYCPYTRSDGVPNKAGTGTTNTELYGVRSFPVGSEGLGKWVVSDTTLVGGYDLTEPPGFSPDYAYATSYGSYSPFMTNTTDGSRIYIALGSNGPWVRLARGRMAGNTATDWVVSPLLSDKGSTYQSVFGYSSWSTTVAILWSQQTLSAGSPPGGGSEGVAFYFDTDDLATYFSIMPPVPNNRVGYLEADLSAVQ